MIKYLLIFCFLFSIEINCEQYWQREEKQILIAAKLANRPVIAVFLRLQDCPWSQKLQEEVLNHPLFCERIGCDAILWQVDLTKESDGKALREKYQVEISPLILLLDPRGKEFARLEYLPLNVDGYVTKINDLIDQFQEICLALDNDGLPFDEEKWRDLYQKARQFSVSCFKQVLMDQGMKQEKGTFFHLEKLASLLEKHKIKNPQVRKFKQQVLERDPENQLGTHFKVAVLEFNKILSRIKQRDRQEKPLKPLFRFLQRFGNTNDENLWKAEWMIAEYLFTRNSVEQALQYAEAAYVDAPDFEKPRIMETIGLMKKESGHEAGL